MLRGASCTVLRRKNHVATEAKDFILGIAGQVFCPGVPEDHLPGCVFRKNGKILGALKNETQEIGVSRGSRF
jgi:hypothetical protein